MMLPINASRRTWLPLSVALALTPTAALAAPDKGDTGIPDAVDRAGPAR